MARSKFSRFTRIALGAAILFAGIAAGGTGAQAKGEGDPGAVYVLTNQAAANAVAVFDRAANGSLTPAGTYSTGGLGTGSGLGSQGAVVLSENNRWLFAVNAGSNDVSVFAVNPSGLTLVDKEPSGGTAPISLTASKDLLYVLNAGGNGNISGFRVGNNGNLSPIAGSTRPLGSNAAGPAQVQFSPDGGVLVVTEKATNTISTYTVGKNGVASGPTTQPAAGVTPFGFAFAKRDKLVVSEAFGGGPNASALSSYNVSRNGGLSVVTASAGTHQTAACWVAVTGNGKYAYTTNAGSASVSGYSIAQNGSLALLNANGQTGITGTSPTDLAASNNSRYLYVLNAGSHSISAFQIGSDGSLAPAGGASGLPVGAVGLAAR